MSDKQIILNLGGPSKVSNLLGYPKSIGPQRVWNWMNRGIPAKVKLEYPHIFLQKIKIANPMTKLSQEKRRITS